MSDSINIIRQRSVILSRSKEIKPLSLLLRDSIASVRSPLHPVKASLLKPLWELKAVLLGNVWAHVIGALFPDLYLLPNDPDSCLLQLLQLPVLFKETSPAEAICMDCSSFKGRGRAGVFVISGWIKGRDWASDDTRRKKKQSHCSLIRFPLVPGRVESHYLAHDCKHVKSIYQTTRCGGGRAVAAHKLCPLIIFPYSGCPKLKKNFRQFADGVVKWHPDPVADAAGWGGVGGWQGRFHLMEQLSYPIMHYYGSHLQSLLPCPIEAGWKTSGHHGNSAESVATPWKSETSLRSRRTTPRHGVWNFSWVITESFTWSVFLLMMYLDMYSLERVSMATSSLDSTTSRSNLASVWHCVSDSFRCFEGRGQREREQKWLIIHVAGFHCLKTRLTVMALWVFLLV